MNEGNTTAKVAVNEPRTLINSDAPDFDRTSYPTYVAELIPIGPGVICEMATMSVNVVSSIQP